MLFWLVVLYVGFGLFAYGWADRLIFFPHAPEYTDTSAIIKIEVEDGQEISALHLAGAEGGYTLLFSHGNAEDLGDVRGFLGKLRMKGYSVLAYDYRGYGTSDGKPSEENCYRDIDAAYDYLVSERGVPPNRIIAHGRSLGSAVAIELASRREVAGLIIESSFASAFRVVTKIPLVPFDAFENINKIPKVACPVLMMHGQEDKLIGWWQSKKLFAAANEPKMKLWVEGAGHNDLAWKAGQKYWDTLAEFVQVVGAAESGVALNRGGR